MHFPTFAKGVYRSIHGLCSAIIMRLLSRIRSRPFARKQSEGDPDVLKDQCERESGTEPVSAPSPERSKEGQNYFAGIYSDWAEASGESTGFETRQILEKVLAAALNVKR